MPEIVLSRTFYPGGEVTVTATGAMFDGSAPGLIDQFCNEIVSEVSSTAMSEVMFVQQGAFVHPTGNYWGNMRIDDTTRATDRGASAIVHDQGVIYGHWLEGDSERNKASRFKGYQAWRKGFQATVGQVSRWAQVVADRVWRGRLTE